MLRAIPDEVVVRAPAPTRRGRPGSAPPTPPDVLGPVIRVVVLTAAMTGLRQSELLGLRWRDVDWPAQRIRVRNAWVRGEHSAEGKSDLSTRRSVPMADRLARELDRWSQRTALRRRRRPRLRASAVGTAARPHQAHATLQAGVRRRRRARPIRFHDLRHTFATRLAASGQPMRTIQEFLGHADSKTTQIYAHYAPSAHEVEMVNEAFAAEPSTTERESATQQTGP